MCVKSVLSKSGDVCSKCSHHLRATLEFMKRTAEGERVERFDYCARRERKRRTEIKCGSGESDHHDQYK